MFYHSAEIRNVLNELKTSEEGLSDSEAKKRLAEYGPNEIKEKKKISPVKIFINQFKSFMVAILIAAVAISAFIGETLDAVVIALILVINAILGFIQEYKAERAIEALKKLASLKAKVIRDKDERMVDASELVPGDIIILEVGSKVPADSRIISLVNLQAQEAALTGESLPVKKELKMLPEKIAVADRKNMVFSGTIVTAGRGKAVVVGTGMNSEIGRIAELIQTAEEKMPPLQLKLQQLGKWLGIATIVICIAVFALGVLNGKNPAQMFIAAVSLAVAAIPEGLPAVVTISLALGVQRMIRRNSLIRRLPSVETLGSTTVICTDKTGTLTCNEMTVKKVFADNMIIDVSGEGYSKEGFFYHNKQEVDPKSFSLLFKIGALCNDSKLSENGPIGDPTELSLIVSAHKAGLIKDDLEEKYPRIGEIGFSSERKRMSTYHKDGEKKVVYCKGAPDVILELCDRIYVEGEAKRLTRLQKNEILRINESFASQALRVLGFAYTESDKLSEDDLVFVGLQAMIDPPREEVKGAIEKCVMAGIKVIMITGDHKTTAEAIARQIGIKGNSLTGQEIDEINDLSGYVDNTAIYARVNPEHKSKIIDALRAKGHIIAMTGDGVNDAPALKKADIGIAMGITGTDVAKEASDMILIDDNFTSIVNAVEEGRGIYNNIRKFVEYLLSSNFGEILTIFAAILLSVFFHNALPLLAIQILWINLVTDGLPALALGIDPSDPEIMQRPPRKPNENLLSANIIKRMVLVSITMMIGTLAIFKVYLPDLRYAQTMAFSTLVMFQMFNVLNCRSETHSLFRVGIFSNILSNIYLLIAIVISVLLQLLVIYSPLSVFFKTVPLTIRDWLYVFVVSSSVIFVIETMKLSAHLKKRKNEHD